MGFKHTGLFPEQAVNWDWMINKIKNAKREIRVLNLFAYTGGATVACLSAGATVCHVDSSKGMTEWAKENVASSGLQDKKVRFLIDDVNKFVQREIRRGNKYDAIIMDPPSYGRGKNGEIWKFEDNIEELVRLCMMVLSDKPLFFLINSYTTGISSQVLENILRMNMQKEMNERTKNIVKCNTNEEASNRKSINEIDKASEKKNLNGKFSNGEIGLNQTNSKNILPYGIFAKWEKN